MTCIGGTLTQNLFGDFQLSRILIDMHWWDLNKTLFFQCYSLRMKLGHWREQSIVATESIIDIEKEETIIYCIFCI